MAWAPLTLLLLMLLCLCFVWIAAPAGNQQTSNKRPRLQLGMSLFDGLPLQAAVHMQQQPHAQEQQSAAAGARPADRLAHVSAAEKSSVLLMQQE